MKVVNINISNTQLDALYRVLDEIDSYGDSLDEKSVLIVPDNYSLNAEKLYFEHLEKKSTFNVEFLTFSRLANKTLKEVGLNINLINKTTAELILTKIIYEEKDKLKLFNKPLKNGVLEEIYNTINQFKSSCILPQEIEIANNNSLLSQKLHDIKFLYTKFEDEIKKFGLDGSTRLNLFCEQIKNSESIKNTRFFFAFFESFTYQQQMVLLSLIKHAKSVSFGLSATTFQPNSSVYLNENLIKVLDVVKLSKIKANIKNFTSSLPPVCNHILNNAFSYNKKTFDLYSKENVIFSDLPIMSVTDGLNQNTFKREESFSKSELKTQIALVEAKSEQEEVEFIAKQIKSDMYFKQIKPNNIQVAVCDLESYAPIINQVFTKFGLDFYISKNEKLNNNFFVRDLKNIISLISSGFLSREYFAYLKSSVISQKFVKDVLKNNDECFKILNLDDNVLNLSIQETSEIILSKYLKIVQQFENYTLKFGVMYSPFTAKLVNVEDNFKQQINLVVNLTTTPLINLYNSFKQNNEALFYTKGFFNFFEEIYAQTTLNEIALEFNTKADFYHEKITEHAFKNVVTILNDINLIFDNKVIEPQEFFSIFITALENIKISILPIGANQIYVADSSSNSFINCSSMYIVGATINTFPNFKQDLGILSDQDISKLNCKKNLEPTIRDINKKEKYTCFELLTLATKKLVVSYALSAFGANQTKSEIFNIISSLFTVNNKPISIIKTANIFSSVLKIADESKKNQMLASILGNKKHLIESSATNEIIKKVLKKLEPQLKVSYKFTHQNNIIEARQLFLQRGTTSVSKIETYYACPYKHFLQYGIKLKERELFDIKPLDIGNIMHAVVEVFVKKLAKSKMKISKENFSNIIEDIFEYVCQKEEFQKLNSKDYIFNKKSLLNESIRVCDAIYYQLHNSSFKPSSEDVEKSFNFTLNGFNISGKIDRIDTFNDMIRLIDYKTGKAEFSFNEIYYGNKLQLMIYALAISNIMQKQVAGVFYFPIKNSFAKTQENLYSLYKLSGTYLNSIDVLKLMDNKVCEDFVVSDIVKGKIKISKEGEIELDHFTKAATLTPLEFQNILLYAKEMFIKACDNILEGDIQKSPKEIGGFSYCKNCTYNSICGYNENAPFRKQNLTINKDSFIIGEKDGEWFFKKWTIYQQPIWSS